MPLLALTIIPEAGVYQINVQCRATASAQALNLKLRVYIDGSNDVAFDQLRADPQGGQAEMMTYCQTRSFTQGQVLKVSFESITDTSLGANVVFSGFFVG